ncbi:MULTISPECIES: DUF4190 domain-containing protein [Brevibacterium]|uniref:DUF4190 domain-containing protein n=1 Tax=Brevibacterium antiquum CNRZ 918 TaxID=1255637 RepID=A0A2H1KVG3_9MICO|nr:MULTISPECIES: DUF4190 domain-containing protein [Brevibacterium]SMY03554.1 protein of unknown function (DUF4190) [Brevibacterium antiquum CNRZ 918]HCG55545.1 DUF4190 domain-containing protein [Brevibacterium sp.]
MSSQNNWNNPDMYYQQPQSGPATGSGYNTANASYGAASYNSNAAYGANAQYAGGGPGYGYQPLPPTNTLAIIALVASIFGVISSFFLAGIAGIVMGHMARNRIRQSGERGDGMAVAALWVGYIGTALWVLFWVGYVGVMVLIFGVAMVGAGSAG